MFSNDSYSAQGSASLKPPSVRPWQCHVRSMSIRQEITRRWPYSLLVFGGRPELALMVTTGVSGVVCGGAVCHNRRAAPGQRETRQAMPRGGSIKEKMARKLKKSAPKRTPPKKSYSKKCSRQQETSQAMPQMGKLAPSSYYSFLI